MNRFGQRLVLLSLLGALLQAGPAEDIHAAVRNGELERVRQLLRSEPALLNLQDQLGRTPLLEAVLARQWPVAAFLIEKGANVNAPDREGQTPLLMATFLGATELVKSLLGKGAEPGGPGHVMGFTPLHLAARAGHRDIAELLLVRGAPISARDRDGSTPLALAASEGRGDVIGLLLTEGASIEAADRRGSTPLLLAALNGHREAVKLLVSKGAGVNARNSLGSTPLSVAVRERHSAIADLLLAAGARRTSVERLVLEGDYLGQKRPGRTAGLFAPGVISTEKDELNSVFAPDGREFYFAIRQTPFKWTIMVMKRTGKRWGTPEVASFSGEYSDVDLSISPDGRKLFYCSNRPHSGKGEPKKDFDIWVVERTGDGWSEPRNLGAPVNSDEPEFYPSITRTGTLCFQSVRADCRGARDIYCARLERGAYPQAENLGSPINTEHFESDPFISPEGDYIIFTTNMPGGFGQGDLHISFRTPEGGWTPPKNLGRRVNTEDHENCAMVSPDGRYLFFTRAGDIYWVDAGIIGEYR